MARNGELLGLEQWELYGVYIPRSKRATKDFSDVAEELLRSSGRFKSPLSWVDRSWLRLLSVLSASDVFGISRRFVAIHEWPVSYAWQPLVRYLIRKGVLEPPNWRGKIPHDDIQLPAVRFYLQGLDRRNFSGSGHALDLETSFSKAIGEGLERFFLSDNQVQPMRIDATASVVDLRKRGTAFVHPARLSHFSEEQKKVFPVTNFSDETVFRWTKVRNLVDGKSTLAPTQCFTISRLYHQGDRERVLREQNTNAAAGGFTRVEALISGICEAIERDAFLVHWLNRLSPPQVDVSPVEDEALQKLLRQLNRYQLKAYFFDLTSDVEVPVCGCVLVDQAHGQSRLAVGASANFDITRAITSSLTEALIIHHSFHRIGDASSIPGDDYIPFQNRGIDLHERVRIWKEPAMFEKANFLFQGEKKSLAESFVHRKMFNSSNELFESLIDIFRRRGKGYEVYFHEVESPVLKKIGYHVVKVVIPELLNLHLYETDAPLAAARLQQAPLNMGRTPAEKVNPWPHPFP